VSNGEPSADWIAWLLSENYGFAPVDPLKYEQTVPDNNIASHFLANHSNTIKILIQYDKSDLEQSE
jgi:hypothetical protein